MSGELRIPTRLLSAALASKQSKQLRLFASAKLEGHRSKINCLCKSLAVHPRTCRRLVKAIVSNGWAGTDGKYLFPRSWRKLKLSKRGGLYLLKSPRNLKRFEALCLAMGLKRIYRQRGSPHSNKRRVLQEDFPTGYLSAALGLKERRFKTLKSRAQKYGFISVIPQVRVIGEARDFEAMKKHLNGVRIFIRGKYTVTPEISKIRVLV